MLPTWHHSRSERWCGTGSFGGRSYIARVRWFVGIGHVPGSRGQGRGTFLQGEERKQPEEGPGDRAPAVPTQHGPAHGWPQRRPPRLAASFACSWCRRACPPARGQVFRTRADSQSSQAHTQIKPKVMKACVMRWQASGVRSFLWHWVAKMPPWPIQATSFHQHSLHTHIVNHTQAVVPFTGASHKLTAAPKRKWPFILQIRDLEL